jgi:DNA gyrase/topoisomerase IV subunit B
MILKINQNLLILKRRQLVMANTKKKETYNSDSIKTLEGTAAVRKRPGMYIGSIGEEGVLRLFYEALGNAIDEFQAGRAGNILVKVDERTSEIQISDDGIGLPQDKIQECCTVLHSSGKFENEYSKYSIGQNGVKILEPALNIW